MGSPTARRYTVHDRVDVTVESRSTELLGHVCACLGSLQPSDKPSDQSGDGASALPHIRLSFEVGCAERIGAYEPTRPLWSVEDLGIFYHRYPDRLVTGYAADVLVEYDTVHRRGRAFLSGVHDAYYATTLGLTPVLDWELKAASLHSLHGAAVDDRGRGLLLLAPSGVGKSTTAVSLARSGFRLLHDDVVWFSDEDHTPRLFRVPSPVRLRGETLEALNIGREDARPSGRDSRGKDVFYPGGLPGTMSVPSSVCAAICFLERDGKEITEFREAGKLEAFQRLTEQSFVTTDPLYAKESLRALIGLFEAVPRYVVSLGTDLGTLEPTFRRILE